MRATQARSSSSLRALAQREHRLEVVDLLEGARPARAPTRWVGESGVTQLRVLASMRAQLVEQRVVLVVADLGVVEDVVAVVVVIQRRRSSSARRSARPALLIRRLDLPAAGASSRAKSKRGEGSIPAWSVRSKWIGVTAIRPSATAARSVPSSSS